MENNILITEVYLLESQSLRKPLYLQMVINIYKYKSEKKKVNWKFSLMLQISENMLHIDRIGL